MEPHDYHSLIDPVLASLEDEYDVDIITARAIGARARGTEHEDSDVDVFAVCCNEQSALVTGRDAVYREFETFDDQGPGIDVQLWSLSGVYDGILDDNPTMIHALDSTHTVTENIPPAEWFTLERHVLEQCNLYALLHHYRSLAKKNYKQYIDNGNDQTVNRLFFITDAILRALYIEEIGDLPQYESAQLTRDLQFEDTVGSYVSDHHKRGFADMNAVKQQGDGDVEYADIVDDDFTLDIERELDRNPREYDSEHFGPGVNPDMIDSQLRRIALETWYVGGRR